MTSQGNSALAGFLMAKDPSNFIDRTGDRYGKLLVTGRGPSQASGASWYCVCDCGAEVVVTASNIKKGQRSCADCANEARRIDLTGKRFGRLVVLGREGGPYWNCQCDCGNPHLSRGDTLTSGDAQSCGCLGAERRLAANLKHGMNSHQIYHAWENMRARCFKPDHVNWARYGGRGITVCERWSDFANFRDDMLPTWQEGLTLDRIDPNGNYEPSNCKWATRKEQSRNQERTRKIEFNGEMVVLADLAEQHGIKMATVYQRWHRGVRGLDLVAKKLISTASRAGTKGGPTHRMSGHPAYNSWRGARKRCEDPTVSGFENYGGRGIRFCDHWQEFENFWADMGLTWAPGLTLDRINVDGDYTPENCRWATATEQAENRRTTKYFVQTPGGLITASQAARDYGLNRNTIVQRLQMGWAPEDILKPPN